MDKTKIKTLKNISTGLVLLAIVFAFLISGIRILGFQVFGVLTGSMEPTYPTGSLIYVKPINARELRVNDVITFSLSPNVVATHRIVELVPDEDIPSIVRFRTKGDANDVVDAALVSESNIIGKVYFCVPQLGNLASYIQEPPGLYVAILVCILMIAFVFYTDSLENKLSKGGAKSNDLDVAALVNKVSTKLLGKPLMKGKQPKPQAEMPVNGYMQQNYQQPQQQGYQQYPQQPQYQAQPQYQQPQYQAQPQYQQPQYQAQPQYQQPQYQAQPQYQQPQYQAQPQYQQPQYQAQPQYQQPQYQAQPQYQQPQYQQPQQNYQANPYQPRVQPNWSAAPGSETAAQPQQTAPRSYPTMYGQQPQQAAPRRRAQRNQD